MQETLKQLDILESQFTGYAFESKKLVRKEYIKRYVLKINGSVSFKLYWANLLTQTFVTANGISEKFEDIKLTRFSGAYSERVTGFLNWYKTQLIESSRDRKINEILE